jgi:hypothetical protein
MPNPAKPSFSAAGRDKSKPLLWSLEDNFRRYGLILSWCGGAGCMGRCASVHVSSMTLGVSERLKVYVPELRRPGLSVPVTLEAELLLLCKRPWLAGACDGRSLAMAANRDVDDDQG